MKGYFEKMKKFVLAFGIPVLAVASLIGSGYATWYFNGTIDPDNDGKIGLKLTEKAVGAKFKHEENTFNLVLDQTDKSETDGMPAGRKGVHFEGAFSESLTADDGDTTNESGTPSKKDTFVNGTIYEVTTTINIPSEVAKYVNFTLKSKLGNDPQPDDQTSSATKLTLTQHYTLTVEGNDKEEFVDFFKIAHDTSSSHVTVAYAHEPSTSAEYETMKADVSGQTIGISFEAKIVAK